MALAQLSIAGDQDRGGASLSSGSKALSFDFVCALFLQKLGAQVLFEKPLENIFSKSLEQARTDNQLSIARDWDRDGTSLNSEAQIKELAHWKIGILFGF